MAERKKLDSNTIIGIVLIGAIVIWMSLNKPEPVEEVSSQQDTEQVKAPTPQVEEQTQITQVPPVVSDSLRQVQAQNRLGAFSYGETTGKAIDGVTTVSNNVLQLKVSNKGGYITCLLYTSPSPRDQRGSRMPSSA